MQCMEQEIKELQSGLGTVVQALNFLVTFLESDYGLKFQFHAYCNSPAYSQNSNVLEVVKQKYGILGVGAVGGEISFINNTRPYHHQQQSSHSSTQLGPYIEKVKFSESFIAASNVTTDLSSHDQTNTIDGHSNQRTQVIVDEEDIQMFGIGDLAEVVKVESHSIDDLIQQSDTEMEVFDKSEFDDVGKGELGTSNDEGHDAGQQAQIIKVKISSAKNEKAVRVRKEKVTTESYKCPHCRRKYPDREKLELHMSHHKQQFECSECGIWLAGKSVLSRHMRTHTGDRPFSCEFCKETFSRQDIVKKHIQRKHKPMFTGQSVGT